MITVSRSRPFSSATSLEVAAPVALVERVELGLHRHVQVARDDRRDARPVRALVEGRAVDVERAVVVEVPEPGREAVERTLDAALLRHVAELALAIVLVQPVGVHVVGHVQVRVAVGVDVAEAHTLGEAQVGRARRDRDVDERAVAPVLEQLARMAVVVARFGGDVQVQVAVPVVVGPVGALARIPLLGQPGGEGDVDEPSGLVRPLVLEQRHGVLAVVSEPPAAARDQDVGVAVGVVVGLREVQAALDALEAGRLAPVLEAALARVVEVARRVLRVVRGEEQVHATVEVVVLGRGAAGEVEVVQAELGRDVDEARELRVGRERRRRDEVLLGHAVRVLADGHVGEVEEPASRPETSGRPVRTSRAPP
jgi:hypothetical protein